MRGPRPQVLGVLAVLVAAWAHAGGSGAEKLRLVSLSDAPDPVSFPVAGVVDVTGSFEARPTDAGGGNSANGKTFAMLASVSVSDSTGQVVIELNQEFAVVDWVMDNLGQLPQPLARESVSSSGLHSQLERRGRGRSDGGRRPL